MLLWPKELMTAGNGTGGITGWVCDASSEVDKEEMDLLLQCFRCMSRLSCRWFELVLRLFRICHWCCCRDLWTKTEAAVGRGGCYG